VGRTNGLPSAFSFAPTQFPEVSAAGPPAALVRRISW
jgi:hypothetical protein